LANYIEN